MSHDPTDTTPPESLEGLGEPAAASELLEAEALRRALDREFADDSHYSEDALGSFETLETAHLLAFSAEGGDALPEARLDALLDEALSGARTPQAPEAPKASAWLSTIRRQWALLFAGFAVAAAGVLVVLRPAAPGFDGAWPPAPSASLLLAQAAAAAEVHAPSPVPVRAAAAMDVMDATSEPAGDAAATREQPEASAGEALAQQMRPYRRDYLAALEAGYRR